MVVVFPVPGPPVSTATRWVRAVRTASCCFGVNASPMSRWTTANACGQSKL